MAELLKDFSLEIAKEKNKSFNYFLEKADTRLRQISRDVTT
jgi:hypothetical protein